MGTEKLWVRRNYDYNEILSTKKLWVRRNYEYEETMITM